jgi:UDP-glucose-4-epimerase GalE
VAGTLALLDVMRDRGVDTIVFSSTCATYGFPQAIPIPDSHAQNPINPYGATKLMIERMLTDFAMAYGLQLRYFNAAGADPDGEVGEDHDPETHLIPLVLEAAAGKRSGITIFGTDYETPDGTCIRDYVHVTDLAKAHVLALRVLEESGSSTSYNLGTGHGISVREVIRTAETITGRKIRALEGSRRLGDPSRLVADATRANNEPGWKPQHSELEQIITTAWDWAVKCERGRQQDRRPARSKHAPRLKELGVPDAVEGAASATV